MTVGFEQRHQTGHRRRPLWLAALVHRISGVLLAAFLPLHFLALGLAIEGEARLDGFLKWSEQPLVKVAEAGLIVLLVVHLLGGLRLLVVENLPWRNGQKSQAMAALAIAAAAGVVFYLVVMR
jgi:fumarate reductase subunit D